MMKEKTLLDILLIVDIEVTMPESQYPVPNVLLRRQF